MKRLFDIGVSCSALVILAPVMFIIAALIKLESPGPILYRAIRVGKDGKPFKLYKFRSMVSDADKRGPGITGANDSRITRMGRFLRKSKLDELPQFLNVLRGEMSVVGPRPEDPRYVALYTPEQRNVLRVRPGITSPASVRYRHEEAILKGVDFETVYVQKIMPEKLAIDLEYIAHPTLARDLRIIWQTALSLFR